MYKIAAVFLAVFTCFITRSFAQIPAITHNNGHHALLVDGKPFFIIGGQAHNSSAWPALLPGVWQSAQAMHLNTVEAPVYWEAVEPEEGSFNFSSVDTLLAGARAHNMHLVMLWFGTWKNGSNHYMPLWMKKEAAKYPNIVSKNGTEMDSPSPNADATMQADAKAFAALMRYLKKSDGQHTVLMVQVENESGAWGSVRDYSPAAQRLFEGNVPGQLLKPDVLNKLHVTAVKSGNWLQVFGDRADEYFHAWSVASFINKVAAAGKAEYPLPLYTNAALRNPLTNPPATQYESGGPTDNVIPIWQAGAPALDLLAPDIYLPDNEQILTVLDLYSKDDNALLVPEAGLQKTNAKYLFAVLAHGGIGYAPFGIDNNGDAATDSSLAEVERPFAKNTAMVSPAMRELAQWSYEGSIQSVMESDDHKEQTVDLGNWQCTVWFGGNGRVNAAPKYGEPTGYASFVKLSSDQFLIMAEGCHIRFQPTGKNKGKVGQYLSVEEGTFANGKFIPTRILNGDETDFGGPGFGATPAVVKVSVAVR